MPLPQAQIVHYPAQALTTAFHIQGGIESIGPVLDFINDRDRQFFQFYDATVSSLTPGPLGPVTRSRLIIPKTEMVAIYIDNAAARSAIQLLQRVERCILYLPNLVCRGEFHLGADTRWTDMVSLSPADFFAMTAVSAFPLVTLPGPFPQQTDLLILNRRQLRMLHLDQP